MKLSNLTDVEQQLDKIRRLAEEKDHQLAHEQQERMYVAVLELISRDPTDAQAIAGAALKAEAINFKRWYA